jgi:hypothetical protein
MIHGHKPNGYLVTTVQGVRLEQETRQCVHCQYMWVYNPGSGDTRGFCLNCGGFICGRPQCAAQQKYFIEQHLAATQKVRGCIPLEEWNNRRIEKLAHKFPLEPGLTVTADGLIVPEFCTKR